VTAIKTSRSWGVPPTQILQGRPSPWGPVDTKLSMALTILEDETCKECGIVSWHGHSANASLVFKHDKVHCYGCAELEKKRAEESRSKRPDDHGAKPYVAAAMFDGSTDLPSRADEYERREARRRS